MMLRQAQFLLIASAMCLPACKMALTTTEYVHHGTEGLRSDVPFYYVAYNVVGTAAQTYTLKGGGDVQQGALADAKVDMMRQFPLGPNQAYVNFSIDRVQTVFSHLFWGLQKVVVRCVVSADVIEYGSIPSTFVLESIHNHPGSKSKIEIGNLQIENQPEVVESKAHTDVVQEAPTTLTIRDNHQVGDEIQFLLDEVVRTGEVIRVNKSAQKGIYYSVSYDLGGRTKYTYVYPNVLGN